MNSESLKKFLSNLNYDEKIYVYMGTYICNYPGLGFRINRDECDFFTPAYNLYRELKSEEDIKIGLYMEQMFELDNTVIKKSFDTLVESNKYFSHLRDLYIDLNKGDSEESFVKIYKPKNNKRTN